MDTWTSAASHVQGYSAPGLGKLTDGWLYFALPSGDLRLTSFMSNLLASSLAQGPTRTQMMPIVIKARTQTMVTLTEATSLQRSELI